MDPRHTHFPEPDDIAPLAIEFAKMMFAHACFEAQVRELQGAITCVPDFGERRRRQWNAKERPKCMAKLINEHLGAVPQAEPIKKILTEAETACRDRNLLAHGDPKTTASVRAMAAERVLDRGYGRPPQLNTTDAGQFRRAVDMTDDELARIASGGAPAEQPPLDPKKVN